MDRKARGELKPLPFSSGEGGEVDLNEYDKVRKIHAIIPDGRSLSIGSRTLATEMSCPICLDLLTQTMTAKECLHRFCSECITMALQRGNKECPTCRKKLVSKRSLRPDPNFDLLITKIWPDRSVYEALQNTEVSSLTSQTCTNALMDSIEEGMKAQDVNRRKRVQNSYEQFDKTRRPRADGEGDDIIDEIEPLTMNLDRERNTSDLIGIESAFEPSGNYNHSKYTDYLMDEDDDPYDEIDEHDIEEPVIDQTLPQTPATNTDASEPANKDDEADLGGGDYYDDYDTCDNYLPPDQANELRAEYDEVYALEMEEFEDEDDDEESVLMDELLAEQAAEEAAKGINGTNGSGAPAVSIKQEDNSPKNDHLKEYSPISPDDEPGMDAIGEKVIKAEVEMNLEHGGHLLERKLSCDEKTDPMTGNDENGELSEDDSDSSSSTYSSSGFTSSSSDESSTLSMVYSDPPMDVLADELQQVQNYCEQFAPIQQPEQNNYELQENGANHQVPFVSTARPPSQTLDLNERLNQWLDSSPSSPQTPEEDMNVLPERTADEDSIDHALVGTEEIEAELLPAVSLLDRECPDELLTPRYVRAKHDTTMSHLAAFIHQRAMEECQSNQTDFDADPVPTIPMPKHFYVFSRNVGHHIRKIFLHETMSTAAASMTKGDHLVIFYDTEGFEHKNRLTQLEDVVPSHFLALPSLPGNM